jgi:hypothetical protein
VVTSLELAVADAVEALDSTEQIGLLSSRRVKSHSKKAIRDPTHMPEETAEGVDRRG